jgi:hypothetical protein
VLRLYFGFDGLDEADMEILTWGVVRSIRAHGGVKLTTKATKQGPWTITCDPFFSAFQQRPNNDPEKVTLFYASSVETVGFGGILDGAESGVASAYTAGDTTLQVGSVTGFHMDGDGGLGAVIVYDGDDEFATPLFYGTFTGTSGGDTFDQFKGGWLTNPTSDADVSTDGTAVEVPILRNHPSVIFRQILTSTGTGLNGTLDVYPVDWGLSIDEDYVDNTDAGAYRDASNIPTGTFTPDQELVMWWIPTVPVTNALQSLIQLLSPGGWFPVIYQGAFSVRCAVDPDDTDIDSGITILDSDIDDGPDAITFEAFSMDSPIVYSTINVKGFALPDPDPDVHVPFVYSFSGVGAELPALPAQHLYTIDYSNINTGLLYAEDDTDPNDVTGAMLDTIVARLVRWYTEIPQRYTLRCAGWRLYQLGLGSVVTLTSGQNSLGLFGRLKERDDSNPRARKAVVVGWAPDVRNGKITIELALFPSFTGEFPD